MPGENVDVSSEKPQAAPPTRGMRGRRFIGIQFACCGVYSRIYVNQTETAYEGRCPKCSKPVSVNIGPGGTDNRFFTAY